MAQTGRWRQTWAIAVETGQRAVAADVVLAAAGVAFFALLSIIPALGALVAVYGLFADPDDVADELTSLLGADQGPGREWLLEQVDRVTAASTGSLTLAAAIGVLVALWSASSGVRHLLDANDAAFGRPRATLVRARVRGLVGAFVLVVAAAIVVGVLALAPDLSGWISWVRYPLVIAVVLVGCAGLYRPGRARGVAPPGAVLATTTWVLGSVGLVLYVAWGPDLQAAYGAFASIVVVMFWLWICGIALLAGAHLTAVLRDRAAAPVSTAGADAPSGPGMGEGSEERP